MALGAAVYGIIKLGMNSPLGGQTETYYLDNSDLPTLSGIAQKLAGIRLHLLATNCVMQTVRVGTHGRNSGSRFKNVLIPNIPLPAVGRAPDNSAALVQDTRTNNAADSIHVQFTTSPGSGEPFRTANRYLRMIPDLYIAGEAFNVSGFASAAYPPSTWSGTPERGVADGFWPLDYLNAWMEFVTKNCVAKRVADRAAPVPPATVGKPISWDLIPYVEANVIRPNTRRVGRPIGPFRGRRRK